MDIRMLFVVCYVDRGFLEADQRKEGVWKTSLPLDMIVYILASNNIENALDFLQDYV
jgi:hypothetical protein